MAGSVAALSKEVAQAAGRDRSKHQRRARWWQQLRAGNAISRAVLGRWRSHQAAARDSGIACLTKGEAIVVTDVGQHRCGPRSFIRSTVSVSGSQWRTGTMGFGVPRPSVAARFRNQSVVAVVGDVVSMTNQELATAVQ